MRDKFFTNEFAEDTWNRKYRHNDESLDDWFKRVSGGNKQVEDLIRQKKFMFGGRVLANRGIASEDNKVTYSNCYVLEPPKDNIESIFDTAKELARTYSYGGGVGVNISNLRPKGSKVRNSAKSTTGATSFMDLYSMVTGLIAQKGRRGALMICMDARHPDIEEFIDIKKDLSRVNFANISVMVDDDFMKNAEIQNVTETNYVVYDEKGKVIDKIPYEINYANLLYKLAENNWGYAEPGMLFWDRVRTHNLLTAYGEFEYAGTNPCGELPLPAYGSCNLGSMNLSRYVLNPFTEKAEFDFESFKKDIETCVVALNEVLIEGRDLHPLEKQKQVIDDYRQIGLGVTGLADMFIKMNVVYGSVNSIDLCQQIWDILLNESIKASAMFKVVNNLESFKGFSYDKFVQSDMLHLLDKETVNIVKQYGMYNSQLLTVPPAGSISILLDCSSGIEPNFEWHYKRKVESMYPEPKIINCTAGIIREFENAEPGVRIPDPFITAHEVNYLDRIEVQGAIQNYIDGSISSTVNLPHEATVDDVFNLYVTAWRKGLKGITVYRDGCEREGVLTTNDTGKKETVNTPIIQADVNVPVQLQRGEKKPIAEDTIYYKREVKIGCGELNLFIGWSEKEKALQDYWVKRKGKGGCECNIETTVISMSLIQRLGASYELVREGFMGVSDCNAFTRARAKGKQLSKGTNCGTAIFNTIEAFEKEMVGKEPQHFPFPKEIKGLFRNVPVEVNNVNISPVEKSEKEVAEDYQRSKCPDCGAFLRREGGCYTCPECGYNKCS